MAAKKNDKPADSTSVDDPVPTDEHGATEDLQALLDEALAENERLGAENQRLRKQQQHQVTQQRPEGLPVVLRRDARVGEVQAKVGSVLAYVTLADGVSLNYLVDAVRTGIAGDHPDEDDESDED